MFNYSKKGDGRTLSERAGIPQVGKEVRRMGAVSNCWAVNLRDTPSIDGKILLELLNNTQVYILSLEKENGFTKVETIDGTVGYIADGYLEAI